MKKICAVLMTCLVIISLTYYIWLNPSVSQNISDLYNYICEYIGFNKQINYDNDFEINDLKLKKQVFYYNNLSDNQKKIYTSMANGIKKLDSKIKIKNYAFIDEAHAMQDIEETLYKFLLDHPEVFYVGEKYYVSISKGVFGEIITLELEYTVENKAELENKIKEIEQAIDKVIEKANIEGCNDFEVEEKIHDLVGKETNYFYVNNQDDLPHNAHTIYGALVEKKAVCDGISKAFQIILDKKDIESIIVTGKIDNNSHAWNMVKIDDYWYNLDLTSNKSLKTGKNTIIHAYFNISTNEIKKTHKVDDEDLIPIANDKTYEYFNYKNKYIKKQDNFNLKIDNIINNNNDNEKLEFKVETNNDNDVPNKILNFLVENKYDNYIGKNKKRLMYYNVLNDYIIIKQ